jgi:pantetheine-phosphate adenylyltransferase
MACIVPGSFDPITDGHVWVIVSAAAIFGHNNTKVVIAENPGKKYHFQASERKALILSAVPFLSEDNVMVLPTGTPLVKFAAKNGVSHIVRGIRDIHDFTYESQVMAINRKIEPMVETMFLVPPRNLTEVSSSMVKGLVGLDDWEDLVVQYVPRCVVEALSRKQ